MVLNALADRKLLLAFDAKKEKSNAAAEALAEYYGIVLPIA